MFDDKLVFPKFLKKIQPWWIGWVEDWFRVLGVGV
jgi:hypothetical protein